MGGSNRAATKCTSKNESDYLNKNFNSLIDDPHVDPTAEASMVVFDIVQKQAEKMKMESLRIRGVKLDYKSPDGKIDFCRVEALCEAEEGLV